MLGLEDEHLPPPVGEEIGHHQSVRADAEVGASVMTTSMPISDGRRTS